LLKDRFICVQEVIPGAETKLEDLSADRRKVLEQFTEHGRFFFGKIRLLSSDGKDVLGAFRSFPGSDARTRQTEGERFVSLAEAVLTGKATQPPAEDRPPFLKGGPPFTKGRRPGFGPRDRGPQIGEQAPDFALKFLNSRETFKLSGNFGKRPTVLIFHSFT